MDVQYLGKIPREELCREQLKAEVMTFPCTYEELFCISAAECQVAGAIPITSVAGSLPTTVETGIKIDYPVETPEFLDTFVRETVDLLTNGDRRHSLQERAKATRTRFDWERIAGEWETLIERIGANNV
jgi:glycosyltransferase involved in cell wall biosynthesis